MPSQYLRTEINRQYSANSAYCIRLIAKPSISFFSSTGDCPISLSSLIVLSVTHFSVNGAGTTSVNGQQTGGFICYYTHHTQHQSIAYCKFNSIHESLLSHRPRVDGSYSKESHLRGLAITLLWANDLDDQKYHYLLFVSHYNIGAS